MKMSFMREMFNRANGAAEIISAFASTTGSWELRLESAVRSQPAIPAGSRAHLGPKSPAGTFAMLAYLRHSKSRTTAELLEMPLMGANAQPNQ